MLQILCVFLLYKIVYFRIHFYGSTSVYIISREYCKNVFSKFYNIAACAYIDRLPVGFCASAAVARRRLSKVYLLYSIRKCFTKIIPPECTHLHACIHETVRIWATLVDGETKIKTCTYIPTAAGVCGVTETLFSDVLYGRRARAGIPVRAR